MIENIINFPEKTKPFNPLDLIEKSATAMFCQLPSEVIDIALFGKNIFAYCENGKVYIVNQDGDFKEVDQEF